MYNSLTWNTAGTVILSRELRIKDKKQLVLVCIQITYVTLLKMLLTKARYVARKRSTAVAEYWDLLRSF